MNEDKRIEKNKAIGQKKKETILRHSQMDCKSYTMKIQSNKLSSLQKEQLKLLFVEAKWFKNYVLSWMEEDKINNKIGKFDSSIKKIIHKDKDMNDIEVDLKQLGSQIKQSLVVEMMSNMKAIKTLKENGYQKGGRLKYVKEIKSIPLNQYKITYQIKGKNYIKVQGIKGLLKVNGLEQILIPQTEICNARLLNKPNGYYIQIVTYKPKESKKKPNDIVGLDFGIGSALTLSNGLKFNVKVQESESLKRMQRKLSRQKKGSKNRYKTINKINKLNQKQSNIKNNISNQIVSFLLNNYDKVVMQDEMISKWHKGLFGKNVQHSILGRIKKKLLESDNVYVLSKSVATTKTCSKCGCKVNLKLKDRTFHCPQCGIEMDRDVHAAQNMIWFYEKFLKIPTEHRDFKPVEIETSTLLSKLIRDNASYMSVKQEVANLDWQ